MDYFKTIAIKDITVNPYQPRVNFDQNSLQELSQSILENGVIQPIIVRKSSVIGYELLAGERRLKAAQMAHLKEIPAIVKELTDQQMKLQAIVENLQRENLNSIEEASSFHQLLQEGLTHEEVARLVGKSRPYISNLVRLLKLPNEILEAVKKGEISQAHARLLLTLSHPDQQIKMMKKIINNQTSVHQLEKDLKKKEKTKRKKRDDPFTQEITCQLSRKLGIQVNLKLQKKEQGQLTFYFSNQEEFERILNNFK